MKKAWRSRRHPAWALIRRAIVAVVGGTITAIGVILLFIPGPGLLVVLLGLAILATEFAPARRARKWIERKARSVVRRSQLGRRPSRQLR